MLQLRGDLVVGVHRLVIAVGLKRLAQSIRGLRQFDERGMQQANLRVQRLGFRGAHLLDLVEQLALPLLDGLNEALHYGVHVVDGVLRFDVDALVQVLERLQRVLDEEHRLLGLAHELDVEAFRVLDGLAVQDQLVLAVLQVHAVRARWSEAGLAVEAVRVVVVVAAGGWRAARA